MAVSDEATQKDSLTKEIKDLVVGLQRGEIDLDEFNRRREELEQRAGEIARDAYRSEREADRERIREVAQKAKAGLKRYL